MLIQLIAVKSAIGSASRIVLEDHVESCLRNAAAISAPDQEWLGLKEALNYLKPLKFLEQWKEKQGKEKVSLII